MAKDGFAWWIDRIRYLCRVYDVLRIDHFRGFDSYYAIPYGRTDAREGRWRKGPGLALFSALEEKAGRQPVIAEDLGFLTDSVRTLLRESGFPGMKVLEFAFDRRDENGREYLPHRYPRHCVAYTGTHDNDTVVGWMSSADPQDLLGLGSEARMNTPSTLGNNWKWRAREGSFSDELAARLRHEMEIYERIKE